MRVDYGDYESEIAPHYEVKKHVILIRPEFALQHPDEDEMFMEMWKAGLPRRAVVTTTPVVHRDTNYMTEETVTWVGGHYYDLDIPLGD